MFGVKKWIVPVATLALLAGLGRSARADDMNPTTAPAGKATVTVTVMDSDSKPVEGARVQLFTVTPRAPRATAAGDMPDPSTTKRKRPKAVAEGKTDKDGKVMLANIADGTYSLAARLKGVGSAREHVTVTGGKDMAVTLTLKAPMPKPEAPAAPTPPGVPPTK